MIRVAVDGRRLQDRPPSGVGRYLSGLLPHLAAGADVTVLSDRRRPLDLGNTPVGEHRLPGFGPAPETVWLQAGVAAWLARHPGWLFHGTFNAVPVLTRRPTVATIYDLAWIQHPEDLPPAKRRLFASQAAWAARHAAVVTTVSEFTRDAIVSNYGIAGDRVVVAPVGRPEGFGPDRATLIHSAVPGGRAAGPTPGGRYIVALGGAPRRGLPVAIEAWRQVTREMGADRPDLVVVGPEQPRAEAGVTWAGPVPDGDWAALLAGADAFCYPTRYEGFGLPALEAAASGTPVVCARVASLPEVLGDAAEWAQGTGPRAIGEALGRVLNDTRRQAQLAAAGLRRAAEWPTYQQSAETVLGAYRQALS